MSDVTALKYLQLRKEFLTQNVNRKREEVTNNECSTTEFLLLSAPNLMEDVKSLEVNRERRH
jgi:hypothetical protein